MKEFKNVFKDKTTNEIAMACRNKLIMNGYIYSEAFGWEKPEILERFGLNPNEKSISSQLYDGYDYENKKSAEYDNYGKKTGNNNVIRVKIKTDQKYLACSQNYIAYKKYKEEWYRKFDAEEANKDAFNNLIK